MVVLLRPDEFADEGALGTIYMGDTTPPPDLGRATSYTAAGAFSTYSQAGQNYGKALLWTLLPLVPVLYVNQEMVLHLGAVTGVGHARLIMERFGRFWGAFSIINLFLLNALTSSPNSLASISCSPISARLGSGVFWWRLAW